MVYSEGHQFPNFIDKPYLIGLKILDVLSTVMGKMRKIARIYDKLFKGVTGDLAFYLNEAKKANGKILELGVGTGRIYLPIVKEKLPIIGLDNSSSMLNELRKKARTMNLKINVYKKDMKNFRFKSKFALIIIPYGAFLHLENKEEQFNALKNISKHLKKGGKLILNFFNPDLQLISKGKVKHMSLFKDPSSGTTFQIVEMTNYDMSNQMIKTLYIINEQKNWKKTKQKMYITVRYVFRKQFEKLLKEAGFKSFKLYGGFNGEPFSERSTEMLWVISK